MELLPLELKMEILQNLEMGDLVSSRLVHSTFLYPASYLIKKLQHQIKFTKNGTLNTFVRTMGTCRHFPYSKFQISIAANGQNSLKSFARRFGPEVIEQTLILPSHNTTRANYSSRVNTLLWNSSNLRRLAFLCKPQDKDEVAVSHKEVIPTHTNKFLHLQNLSFNWFLEYVTDLQLVLDICKNAPNLQELKILMQFCSRPRLVADTPYVPLVVFSSLVAAIPKIQILKLGFPAVETEPRLLDFSTVPAIQLNLKELEILNGIDKSPTVTYTPSICYILQGILVWFSKNAKNLKILRFEKMPDIPYTYSHANVTFPVFPELEELDITYGPREALKLTPVNLPSLKRLHCHVGQYEVFSSGIFQRMEQLELDPAGFHQTFNGNKWQSSFPNVTSLTVNGRVPVLLFKQKNFNLNLKELKISNSSNIFPYAYFAQDENIIMDFVRIIHKTNLTSNDLEPQQEQESKYFAFSTLKNLKYLYMGECDRGTVEGVVALSCVQKLAPLKKLTLHCITQLSENVVTFYKNILENYHDEVCIKILK